MSSEAILENPALFSGLSPDLDEIALEYLEYAKKYQATLKQIKAHLMKFLYQAMTTHPEIL